MNHRVRAGLVCLAGAGALRASFRAEPGSRRFYALTGQVALTWFLGGAAVRPEVRRRGDTSGSIPAAVGIGAGAFGVFYAGARIARHIGPLRTALAHVLRYAEHDSPLLLATTLVNGAAEEVFFRGALYEAAGARPVLSSTASYVLVTSASGNPALALASVVMGTLFAVQRKHSGTVVAPLVTHLVWSALMVTFLPGVVSTDR